MQFQYEKSICVQVCSFLLTDMQETESNVWGRVFE